MKYVKSCVESLTYLITVAEHGGKHVLQEGKNMFICFKKTSHGLQFHNIYVWAFSNCLKRIDWTNYCWITDIQHSHLKFIMWNIQIIFYRKTTTRNLTRMRTENNLPLVLTNISYVSILLYGFFKWQELVQAVLLLVLGLDMLDMHIHACLTSANSEHASSSKLSSC